VLLNTGQPSVQAHYLLAAFLHRQALWTWTICGEDYTRIAQRSLDPTITEMRMPAERDRLRQADWITILSDDETYTSLGGCHIAIPTPEQGEELDAGADPNDLDDLERYDLRALLDWAINNGYFDNQLHQGLGGEEGQAPAGACSEAKGLRLGTME